MKTSRFPLALSLLVNLGLAAVVAVKTPSFRTIFLSGAAPKASAAPSAAASGPAGALSPAVSADTWKSLQTADLKSLVARLKAAGFPPAVIRAVVGAELGEKYDQMRRELLAQAGDAPYWKGKGPFQGLDPKLQAALRDLGKEQTAEMKDLLGPDATGNNDMMAFYLKRQFGDLPPDKMDKVQSISQDYNDLRNQIYSSVNGIMLPEDRQKLAYLDQEMSADLAKVLTPDELFNYQIRSSQTANQLRSELAVFNPTEDEFRTLFKLAQQFSDQLGPQYGPLTPEQQSARQAAQQQLNADVAGALGSDRAAQAQEAMNPANFMVNQVVARLGLPQQAAIDAAAVQQDVQQQAAAIRSNQELSGADRRAQLATLQQQASSKLTGILGDGGFQTYSQTGAGFWLQNLTPRMVSRPAH